MMILHLWIWHIKTFFNNFTNLNFSLGLYEKFFFKKKCKLVLNLFYALIP